MEYYDSLETQDQKTRTLTLREALPMQITHAKERSAYYADVLADCDPDAIDSRDALASLPVTRKSELMEMQTRKPPFGGLATVEPGGGLRASSSRPARSMNLKPGVPITGARRALCLPPVFVTAILCITRFPIILRLPDRCLKPGREH